MTEGLTRQAQSSFAGGMFRSGDPSLMPDNAFFDGQNVLLDRLGGLYKRGGSTYRSTTKYGEGFRFIWDGWLATGGQNTIVGTTANYGRLNGDGSITLLGGTEPAKAVPPAVLKGVLYLPGGKTYDGTTVGTAAKVAPYYAVVAGRLLAAGGSKVEFSKLSEVKFEANDLWELPGGVEILGIAGGRESAVVFTTSGVWVIGNMTSNLTDESGNVQQRLDHYSGDLVLWGAGGIASWEGALVVPGTDAVWLVKRGVTSEQISSFSRISDPIVDLYQEYVRAGYFPGQATVFQNHYILPILGGGRVIDTLVCRLDMPMRDGSCPWTRLAGSGGQLAAFATRVTAGVSREPTLIGGTYGEDSRVLNLSYFTPGSDTGQKHDADGTTPEFALTTRRYMTGNLVSNFVQKMRARYQMWDEEPSAPILTAALVTDSPPAGSAVWGRVAWGEFTWASAGTASYDSLAGDAPASRDGSMPFSWKVARKRRYIGFRLTCKDATAQLAIKSIEMFVRPEGKTQ